VLQGGRATERFAGADGGAVVVRLQPDDASPAQPLAAVATLTSLPFVVITVCRGGTADPGWQALSDVIVGPDDPALDDISAHVTARPLASTALALLLRGQARRTIDDGLVAESAVYSTLQAGPEFAAWRSSRPLRTHVGDDGPRVEARREGSRLDITLTRPALHNALDARMRDELIDVLGMPLDDPTVTRVELRGEGKSFCAGGDLNEFGSRSDPATAHLVRLHRSIGSGIELAAFAGQVVARENAVISLTEIGLGLVPGAGGTVSLPLRIGRLRTAWLALSGRSIDAGTAREWGLVDLLTE
jgi:Enoyl-CoA hydratase/isomerase